MFKPKFSYTHKIVNLLTKVSTARELILNSPLIPKWEVTIRREAEYEAIDEKEARDFLANRAIKLKVDIPRLPIKTFCLRV